jgi:hypothetical protein
MLISILLLVSLLDFQRVALPPDIDGFAVEIQEETTTGCAMLPSTDGAPLELEDFLRQRSTAAQDATNDRPAQYCNAVPASLLRPSSGLEDGRLRVMPVPVPQPEPAPEPILVPSPSSVAILSMTGLVLLFLLYGRMRRKPHRT